MPLGMIINPALLLFAAEEGGSFLSNPAVWRVINLAVFVLFLIYILRNKIGIGQVFDRRGTAIMKEIEEARAAKQEAERKLAELESRFGRLDAEVAQIRAEAREDSAREVERIREAATADAEKIKVAARREIEGAAKAARSELQAFVAEQSVALAESIIRKEIGPEDEKRMVARYVDDLREVKG